MAKEINWQRVGYESRIDAMADDVSTFVAAELGTIDEAAARASSAQWAIVCRFFAACADAARAQGASPDGGGKRMARYLAEEFPCATNGSHEGFCEFMDWLSNPDAFRPTRLRSALESAKH
jgi:hypothetical protein